MRCNFQVEKWGCSLSCLQAKAIAPRSPNAEGIVSYHPLDMEVDAFLNSEII